MARELKGRRVKCCLTGEWGTSLTFFKGPDGRYYKTENLYKEKQKKNETHKQLIEELATLMGFTPGMVFPTCVVKDLKQLSFYDESVILETVKRCHDKVEYAMRTKSFDSEYNKAAYIMAIIKNNINDVYKEIERNKAAKVSVHTPVDINAKADLQDIGYTKASHDISDFLFEDE